MPSGEIGVESFGKLLKAHRLRLEEAEDDENAEAIYHLGLQLLGPLGVLKVAHSDLLLGLDSKLFICGLVLHLF